jgi:CMP-N-acetylneuraminic acid synthetase
MIYFIPIKTFSQRIPNKNFKTLSNQPLYKYIINTLISNNQSLIYIDTDSEIVLNEYKNNSNIIVYKRRSDLIDTNTSMNLLIDNLICQFGLENSTIICQLHVTNPFVSYGTIKKALEYMKSHDSVVSCNLIQNRLWVKDNNKYSALNHDPSCLIPTQNLPYIYQENSSFYIFTVDSFIENSNRIGKNPYFYPINFPENIDIDNMNDWFLAEKVLS